MNGLLTSKGDGRSARRHHDKVEQGLGDVEHDGRRAAVGALGLAVEDASERTFEARGGVAGDPAPRRAEPGAAV